jgi:putative transposase
LGHGLHGRPAIQRPQARVLTIVDIFSKLCPAIGVSHAYKGHDVVDTLEAAARAHGRPKRIRVDNGPKFACRDLDLWVWQHGVVLDHSRPGKPTDNAFAEGFNGSARMLELHFGS